MRGAHIGHNAPVRRGDAGEGGDFAQVVHAHFHDGVFVLGLEAQQLKWQAKGIIEIALRLQHVELRPERGGNCFFRGGLAGGAGDGNYALAPLSAHMQCKGMERDERVFRYQQRNGKRSVRQRRSLGARNDGGHRAAFKRCSNEVVPVEALPAHRKEQIAGRHGA